jgi:hypothetical protein
VELVMSIFGIFAIVMIVSWMIEGEELFKFISLASAIIAVLGWGGYMASAYSEPFDRFFMSNSNDGYHKIIHKRCTSYVLRMTDDCETVGVVSMTTRTAIETFDDLKLRETK